MCYDLGGMLRRVNYRTAAIAFVFASLWFILGAMFILTGITHALGIGSLFFGAWLLLFFLMLGGAGVVLTVASFNGVFPPSRAERRRRYSGAAAGSAHAAPRARQGS